MSGFYLMMIKCRSTVCIQLPFVVCVVMYTDVLETGWRLLIEY